MDSAENDGVFLVLEEDKRNAERIENRESKQVVDEADYVETNRRKRRSLDYLDIFKADTDMKNLIRSKRFQRKGADSISEIVEIDLPAGSDRIDITEFLIPKNKKKHSSENAILVVEDSLKIPTENFRVDTSDQNILNAATKIFGDNSRDAASINEDNGQQGRNLRTDAFFRLQNFESNLEKETINRRRKRSVENNQELLDTLQNLENAEVAEVAHIQGEWTNTPCAKRIFCDTMIQRGSDASVLMEKKMTALLRL